MPLARPTNPSPPGSPNPSSTPGGTFGEPRNAGGSWSVPSASGQGPNMTSPNIPPSANFMSPMPPGPVQVAPTVRTPPVGGQVGSPNPGTYGNGSIPMGKNVPATAASNSISPAPAMDPRNAPNGVSPMSGSKRKSGGASHRGGRKGMGHSLPMNTQSGPKTPVSFGFNVKKGSGTGDLH